jgi:hypothetical protein
MIVVLMTARLPASVAVPSSVVPPASRALWVAALVGLVGVGASVGACADDEGAAASSEIRVTSSRVDTTVTLESFTKDCAARSGTLEQHSHCGGANSCKGISYDTGTHVLSEHGCKGLNTCAGFSCVLPGLFLSTNEEASHVRSAARRTEGVVHVRLVCFACHDQRR